MVSTEHNYYVLGRHELTPIEVPIVTVETFGANCFYSSIALNNGWTGSFGVPDEVDIETEDGVKIVHLKKLTSRATSLAATSPSPGVVKMALARGGGVRCLSVPDEITMSAACSFAGNVIVAHDLRPPDCKLMPRPFENRGTQDVGGIGMRSHANSSV